MEGMVDSDCTLCIYYLFTIYEANLLFFQFLARAAVPPAPTFPLCLAKASPKPPAASLAALR